LSIAGIFKEVTTITISALVFGDQLTHLNIAGVVVTVSGIATYTYHKYQKSIAEPIPLDSHGQPVDPEHGGEAHFYARTPSTHEESRSAGDRSTGTYTDTEAVPLSSLSRNRDIPQETAEERTARLRDDFEGWDRRDEDWSEEEEEDEEASLDEVAARRNQRQGSERTEGESSGKSWGQWWDKSL
jgi:solute carrier family 35 protein C2